MTQEEKQLLLRDLCARLPYGVKLKVGNDTLSLDSFRFDNGIYKSIEKIVNAGYKPYLRPLSSMTDEEKKELSKRYAWNIWGGQIQIRYHSQGYWDDDTDCPTEEYIELFNWLNKKHFDYRGLIERGLAIETPEGMYE